MPIFIHTLVYSLRSLGSVVYMVKTLPTCGQLTPTLGVPNCSSRQSGSGREKAVRPNCKMVRNHEITVSGTDSRDSGGNWPTLFETKLHRRFHLMKSLITTLWLFPGNSFVFTVLPLLSDSNFSKIKSINRAA